MTDIFLTDKDKTELEAKIESKEPKFITPISIERGGTNATTAKKALENLGGVSLDGDVMRGFLTLSADPTSPLHAVTKQYVESLTAGFRDIATGSFSGSDFTLTFPAKPSMVFFYGSSESGISSNTDSRYEVFAVSHNSSTWIFALRNVHQANKPNSGTLTTQASEASWNENTLSSDINAFDNIGTMYYIAVL